MQNGPDRSPRKRRSGPVPPTRADLEGKTVTDRTGALRPNPTPLHIRLIGEPGEVDLAVHRLRQSFSDVQAGKPRPLHSAPGKIRLYVKAVL